MEPNYQIKRRKTPSPAFSRLFSIQNSNQAAVMRAVAAATVARETWWQDAEGLGWGWGGIILRLICTTEGTLADSSRCSTSEEHSWWWGGVASPGADGDAVWRIIVWARCLGNQALTWHNLTLSAAPMMTFTKSTERAAKLELSRLPAQTFKT